MKLKGSRILIPSTMRLDVLDKIHQGHLGVTKCRERAKQSIWWPGISTQIVAVDFFKCKDREYLLVVDYFSRYTELCPMNKSKLQLRCVGRYRRCLLDSEYRKEWYQVTVLHSIVRNTCSLQASGVSRSRIAVQNIRSRMGKRNELSRPSRSW